MENRKLLKIKLFVCALLCMFLLGVTSCYGTQWIFFHDDEIKGSVVDAKTNEPIEDVIVVAMWKLTQIPSEGFGGYAKIIIDKTGDDGSFTIPLWKKFKPSAASSIMDELAPKIIIYKPGYRLYYSHKLERAGFPDDMSMTADEKSKVKEKYSITPAKLTKIYADEDRLNNCDNLESMARFPNEYYSKDQLLIIFNALEEELLQLSDENKRKNRLLRSNKKMFEYWTKDNK